MSCEKPLIALLLAKDSVTKVTKIRILGNRVDFNIKSLEEKYGKDNILLLPCGHCASCLTKRRKEWSVRCALEASEHEKNCFVTLTYDEDHVPKKLIKRDLTDFLSKIRASGHRVRFFGCGEYGSQTARPHYHVILFGFMPDDLKPYAKQSNGFMLYTSDFLQKKIWKKGNVMIGEFSPETAGYVAGYVEKKLGKDEGFILMSRRPGIGRKYLEKHYEDIYRYDSFITDGGHINKVPRYFDKVLMEQLDPTIDIARIKARRLEAANITQQQKMMDLKIPHKEILFQYEGKAMKDKLERRKRGL